MRGEKGRKRFGGGVDTKILTLSGWFILAGYALTPHMWDEQNEPAMGSRGPPQGREDGIKERSGRKEEGRDARREACQGDILHYVQLPKNISARNLPDFRAGKKNLKMGPVQG